jgi:hypothetical protein
MSMSTVSTAVQLLLSARKALNDAREHAAISKDTQMRVLVNTAYDQMAELKEAVARVVSENEKLTERIAELQGQREVTPEIRQVGEVNYYFVGEEGPYCQPCYDGGKERRLVRVSPVETLTSGAERRHCLVCNRIFYEKRSPNVVSSARRRSAYSSRRPHRP